MHIHEYAVKRRSPEGEVATSGPISTQEVALAAARYWERVGWEVALLHRTISEWKEVEIRVAP